MAGAGAIPETYEGREQAFIKHQLLESYLEKLFLIVGGGRRTGFSEVCYVDCFAGPWSDESEDLAGTSIAISLNILEKCRETLGTLGATPTFRALFVEKDAAAFSRLESFLEKRRGKHVQSESRRGDFVALRGEILKWCGPNAFSFFFIDPKGWKDISVDTLRPLLSRQKSEFLINFQYDFVNRTMSMPEWREDMTLLLGEDVDVEGLNPHERERRLLDAYRRNLKFRIPAVRELRPRSAYVRVLDPKKERPKYHLVYLTSHPRGIIEFMEISDTVDLVQKQVRAEKKERIRAARSGMTDMFGPGSLSNPEAGHAEPEEVDQYWRSYLTAGTQRVGESEFAEILEQTNWFPQDLQASLVRLIDAREVTNIDAGRKRPKKPLHWDKSERLKLVRGLE